MSTKSPCQGNTGDLEIGSHEEDLFYSGCQISESKYECYYAFYKENCLLSPHQFYVCKMAVL